MEALVNVDSSLICARIIQVFVGAFFYIFMIAKAVGSENKAKWFKRRMKYTFFNKRGIFGEYINFGYSPDKCLEDAKDLKMPPSIKEYIMTTRKRVNDITEMMRENNYHMQKMTINFPKDVDDNYYCRDEVFEHLKKIPEITLVSGGYGNLEFTKAGVDKGVALHKLAQILNIAADETMAVGDTENDMAIVKAAHIGVAMGNATDELKAQADYVTDTNENDGVAKAIRHFMG